MLLEEVRGRCLFHLSCLASSAKGFPSPLCFCGTAGKQLPHQFMGGVRDLATRDLLFPPPCSPYGPAGWLTVLPKLRISPLSVTFHITKIFMYLFTEVRVLCGMGKHSAVLFKLNSFPLSFFLPNTACVVALLSVLARDRAQSKKQFMALSGCSQRNLILFFP